LQGKSKQTYNAQSVPATGFSSVRGSVRSSLRTSIVRESYH